MRVVEQAVPYRLQSRRFNFTVDKWKYFQSALIQQLLESEVHLHQVFTSRYDLLLKHNVFFLQIVVVKREFTHSKTLIVPYRLKQKLCPFSAQIVMRQVYVLNMSATPDAGTDGFYQFIGQLALLQTKRLEWGGSEYLGQVFECCLTEVMVAW